MQHHRNLQWIPPQKKPWSTLFSTTKKIRPTSRNGRFLILRPNLRPLSGSKFVFLKIYLTRIVFWGKIYRELPCYWNHYIIISRSWWKFEKIHDEKFGIFEFWLRSRNNVEMIATLRQSPVNFTPKNTMVNFLFHKKKQIRPTSQNSRFPILRPNLEPLSGMEIFFS